ncbi:MAG: fumarylacetoacetate hydrolase family protein [Acidobacteria bacterium]|nr:fumarylacetoacetate hydrolase family protein [Acidobacteriota bacterium]
MNRRELITGISALAGAASAVAPLAQAQGKVTKYCRFKKGNVVAHGIVNGDTVRQLSGDLFANPKETGAKHKLSEVKLLYPIAAPSKILALAGNYRSHLGKAAPRPNPEPFYKPPSCLQNPEDPIVIPPGATNVHYECELVIVIGKTAKQITEAQARDHIFGVTCGNDVSERIWQNDPKIKDVQWWRAKGADTFGPVGPVIARGIDYGKLRIMTRLNGKIMQDENTSNLVHGCEKVVSFISQSTTLFPGDLIFTGTGGITSAMKRGDVVEIEIEGIGILRNTVA